MVQGLDDRARGCTPLDVDGVKRRGEGVTRMRGGRDSDELYQRPFLRLHRKGKVRGGKVGPAAALLEKNR